MSLILHIDTATENAIISVAEEEHVIFSLTNNNQKDHASFLQPGIKELLKQSNVAINQLDAVSVTAGPGSYTGLRVGMASAKGICYALQIPLITLNTLEVMALSVIINTIDPDLYLYCPMIDARRQEVFTALFDKDLNGIIPSCNLTLNPESFDEFLQSRKIIFCGNGAQKFLNLSIHRDLSQSSKMSISGALALLSSKKFQQKNFADLLHSDPVYLKQFYSMGAFEK
ncbi:MAG: tRNA (adenosine(37)-N6)-threonylcarbamoyltransferase complex dimerization subunit type 1 TsaB [Ginsengibacter sp.]